MSRIHEIPTRRPQRWDAPYSADLTEQDVDWLLKQPPFDQIDESRFTSSLPLRGILRNDARILQLSDGDVVVREGDYGASAFFILGGRVRVALESLRPELLGRRTPKSKGWLAATAQLFTRSQRPEVRRRARGPAGVATRGAGADTRVFLQDVPGILSETHTLALGRGHLFGELAALSRTPRTATVFADGDALLLELRWQGLRDILRRSPRLKEHVDRLYRENALLSHLRATPVLAELPTPELEQIADATLFQSFGEFAWSNEYRRLADQPAAERIAAEPIVAQEGEPPAGLVLIRAGFARVSRLHGHGRRTVSYLGKGRDFGLPEIIRRWRTGLSTPLQHSLHAVGHVDVLTIPVDVVERYVLPNIEADELARLEAALRRDALGNATTLDNDSLNTGLLEFLVEHRLTNGSQTMVIDLDRCTRCDDCVRACAATHDGNPRFLRAGPQYGKYQFAEACMHCADPVCLIGCPTGAIGRDLSGGVIAVNEATCIGCSMCAQSCPYNAIRMVEIRDERGATQIDEGSGLPILQATKCDLCSEQPGGPACVGACAHDALVRIDAADSAAVSAWINLHGGGTLGEAAT